MNKSLVYQDEVYLIDTTQNGYGDSVAFLIGKIDGLFLEGSSQSDINHVEALGTDAHIYLDVNNEIVIENAFRLEGMYIVANLYGGKEAESWYKIARVKVGQRKLLDNAINNVHCFLTKCDALTDVES